MILLLHVGLQAGKAATKDRDAYVYSMSMYACELSMWETQETSTWKMFMTESPAPPQTF